MNPKKRNTTQTASETETRSKLSSNGKKWKIQSVVVEKPTPKARRVLLKNTALANESKNASPINYRKEPAEKFVSGDPLEAEDTLINNPQFEGDDIVVSVHAPEEEFYSSDEDEAEGVECMIENPDDLGFESDRPSVNVQDTIPKGVGSATTDSEIEFRQCAMFTPEQIAEMKSDPLIKQMFNEMFEERFQHQSPVAANPAVTPQEKDKRGKQAGPELIKSPSDTTIYAPALNKNIANVSKQGSIIIDQISNFLDQVHTEHNRKFVTENEPQPGTSGMNGHNKVQKAPVEEVPPTPEEIARNQVVAAEQFKATVSAPKGKAEQTIIYSGSESEDDRDVEDICKKASEMASCYDNDDDFFHIVCHIEAPLHAKIEKGEFVDLEKLLPKDKNYRLSDDSRMELVNRDGATYWTPAEKEVKIANVRRWEQAFRVYATIYCQANPTRSAEILQYIYVINTAASAYQWENVANYDYTFRQLMALKPKRSWAKTYLQMWQLALRDPLTKSNSYRGQAGTANGNKDWRDNCCWCYNKNRCNSPNCGYDHHCTYCGGWGHGHYNCRK